MILFLMGIVTTKPLSPQTSEKGDDLEYLPKTLMLKDEPQKYLVTADYFIQISIVTL